VKQKVQVAATLEGVSLLKDGGVSLRFATNELTSDEKVILTNYYGRFGWLLFAEQEHDEKELALEAIRKDTGGKSPSQRLRAVLYVAYKEKGRDDMRFEEYYGQQMERFINRVKNALDD
jgi:HD superfamily phosphohydrolase YqeK